MEHRSDIDPMPDQPDQPDPSETTPNPLPHTPTTSPDAPPAEAASPPQRNPLLPLLLITSSLLIFAVGFGAGLWARPLLLPAPIAEASIEPTPAAAADAPAAAADAPAAAPEPAEPSDTDREQIMQLLETQTRHFRGDPDAPITLIEFSDFQCPYCGRHTVETVPQLDEAYIEQGLLRVGFYPVAFLGEQSLWAAEAGECAADQDAFWEYHDFLYSRLANEGLRDFSRENLKLFAGELGLDTATFDECMDTEKYAQQILGDTTSAQQLGVRSTPTFLVNGWAIIGAQPFAAFESTIDELLREDGAGGADGE